MILEEAPDNVFWCSFILPDFLSSFLLSYTVYLNVAAGQDFTVIKHWTANGCHLSPLAALSSCWTKTAHIIQNLFQCLLTFNLLQIILKIDFLFFSKYRKSHSYPSTKHINRGEKTHQKGILTSSLTSWGQQIIFKVLAGEGLTRI